MTPCPQCDESVDNEMAIRDADGRSVLVCWNGHRFSADRRHEADWREARRDAAGRRATDIASA